MNKPTMMLVKMQQGTSMSFRLISISPDSEYLEAVFIFTDKILQLICKQKFETWQLIKKLDSNGDLEINKKTGQPKEERRQISANYNIDLTDRASIESVVTVLTGEKHDLEEYFLVPTPPKQLEVVKDAE